MKSLKEYYGGSNYYSNGSYSRKKVYSDIPSAEMKRLDQLAMNKFGRKFVNCDWDEQSGLRSLYQDEISSEDEREKIEDDIEKEADKQKDRIEKEADKTVKDDQIQDDGTDSEASADADDEAIDDDEDEDFDTEE